MGKYTSSLRSGQTCVFALPHTAIHLPGSPQEPEPVKKVTPKPNGRGHMQYGGPGQFVPAGESPPQHGLDVQEAIRSMSTGSSRGELSVPPSLRSSSSRLDLYVPPYETSRSRHSMVDGMANDFAELNVGQNTDRRVSFPVSPVTSWMVIYSTIVRTVSAIRIWPSASIIGRISGSTFGLSSTRIRLPPRYLL